MVNEKYFTIDAHCHVYPDKIAEKAVGAIKGFYDVPSSFKDGKVSTLISAGEKAGTDMFVVQSVATTPKQVRSINNFIAEAVKNNDGKLIGLGTLHPESEDMEGDVNSILELGLHGVKLHPDIQGFKIDDYRCLKIYELCEKAKLPILVHMGDNRYDNSSPKRLAPILEIYTDLIIVGAHLGGWSMWEEASKILSKYPNLYVDCSSSMEWLPNDKMVEIIHRYGSDRVIYGTDFPMFSPEVEIERLMNLSLTDEEYEMILSKNAKKVYKF